MQMLERQIREEAKKIFCNSKLRNKDLLEWSTGEIEGHEDEVTAFLPGTNVWVAIKKDLDKRRW